MKIRQMAAAVGLCVAMLPASAMMYPLQQDAGSTAPGGAGQQPAPSSATPPPATASTTQQPEPQGAAPLRVMVGKSLLINTIPPLLMLLSLLQLKYWFMVVRRAKFHCSSGMSSNARGASTYE